LLQPLANAAADRFRSGGLKQVIKCTLAERFNGALDRAMRCEDNNSQVGVPLTGCIEHDQSIYWLHL
jgi:hypothetical protein